RVVPRAPPDGPLTFVIDQVVTERPFKEIDRAKLVDIESKLLSEFHKKPMRLRAGVVLPESFDKEPERKYPIVYEVPGFGGTHFMALGLSKKITDVGGVEMIRVILDPSCRLGHHVFADSDNNGPVGRA